MPPGACRWCRGPLTPDDVVLDLGDQPPADLFPAADDPGPDPLHPLALVLCPACGLAQLDRDDTGTSEPRAVEPQALRDAAATCVAHLHDWLGAGAGRSVREHGSPHGGTWLPLLEERGWSPVDGGSPAELVVDTFGVMHDADQAAALRERAAGVAPGGTLVLLVHDLRTIVAERRWNALRHGHFAYWSVETLAAALGSLGLAPARAWRLPLYGGCTLLAAVRPVDVRPVPPRDEVLVAAVAEDRAARLRDPAALRVLQHAADEEGRELTAQLEAARSAGQPWWAYGAASRAVAVLVRAGADRRALAGVADASTAKQGRRVPGTDVPVVAPEDLVAADPARVWLMLPDLREELERALPALSGRWWTPGP